jgi:hypothetical protein
MEWVSHADGHVFCAKLGEHTRALLHVPRSTLVVISVLVLRPGLERAESSLDYWASLPISRFFW